MWFIWTISRLESLRGRGIRQMDLFYSRHLSVKTAKAKVASDVKWWVVWADQVPQNIL